LSFKKLEDLTLLDLENIKITLPEYKAHKKVLTIAKEVQLSISSILISKDKQKFKILPLDRLFTINSFSSGNSLDTFILPKNNKENIDFKVS
jgi:hypothetical protein